MDLKNNGNIEFPLESIIASQRAYVPRLVQSIDDDRSNLLNELLELRAQDYKFVCEAVDKIVEENSPKAIEAKQASTKDTDAK